MQNRKTPRAKPEEQIFPKNALLAEFRPSFFWKEISFFSPKPLSVALEYDYLKVTCKKNNVLVWGHYINNPFPGGQTSCKSMVILRDIRDIPQKIVHGLPCWCHRCSPRWHQSSPRFEPPFSQLTMCSNQVMRKLAPFHWMRLLAMWHRLR